MSLSVHFCFPSLLFWLQTGVQCESLRVQKGEMKMKAVVALYAVEHFPSLDFDFREAARSQEREKPGAGGGGAQGT